MVKLPWVAIAFTLISNCLSLPAFGQSEVGECRERIESGVASDRAQDLRIDSMWQVMGTLEGKRRRSAKRSRDDIAHALFHYYHSHSGRTADRSGLYAFLAAMENHSYSTVLRYFHSLDPEPDLWIAAFPMYRHAWLQVVLDTLSPGSKWSELWDQELRNFSESLSDSTIHKFVRSQLPLESGIRAPAIEGPALDGAFISLEELKGSVILVDFCATWCGPCRDELPYLRRFYRDFEVEGNFEILSIYQDRDEGILQKFVSENALRWTHIWGGHEKHKETFQRYRVSSYPTYYLIDKEGIIREVYRSRRDWHQILQAIILLLRE